ncbi:PAS domain-containing protein [Hymenobacter sp. UYCo722]|uniref:PAS domain-containing sensor histidine kinase n=1 Tax=Hymenobacter sp. UYCo722 TaxID=3156335 RepID=UPI0033998DC4
MPDFTAPSLPTDAPAADGLLRAVLDVSLTAINLVHPVYAAEGGELVDFALDYLNPAAQRMTGLPESPGGTIRSHFPDTFTNGIFDFYRRVCETGEAGQYDFNYQTDGFDNYFHVAARRHGEQLVISFLDTAVYSRTVAENVLRESQAREQAARAEAERQRGELERVFEQAPIAIAIAVYRGPNYTIELANPTVCRLWGRTQKQIVGKGLFEALPEVAGMGFEELLDEVMTTGVPYVAYAMEAQHDRNGHRETVYWDFVYEPMRGADGRITGVMVVANEVTAQVLARQQMQQLNDELEMRVTARSAEVRAALHEAEQQREQARVQQSLLGQILGQVPAAIATLSGPEHRYSFFNAPYQALAAGRSVLGHTVAELLPEVVEQGFVGLLDRVYHTGQPFIGTETLIMLHDQGTHQPEQRYIDFIYQPLLDGQQQPQGILAFILDVTDRVRARKQAATLQAAMMGVLKRQVQARQDLFQIFEQTPAAIVLLREPDHRIDYFNPAFAELFPPEEWAGTLQGHTIAEVYPRVKMVGLVKLLDRVFRTGVSEIVTEMPLAELQPGSPRYVTFTYQAYREQGSIVGVAALVYDVTEQVLVRRQTEALQAELLASARQQLQERESFYAIFDQAPALIQLLRAPHHRIEYVNAAYQHLFGDRQLVGLDLNDALPELREQGFLALMNRVYETGETYFGVEHPFTVPAVADQPARVAYFTFVYEAYRQNGQIAGISVFAFEVTEQVLARQQREAQQAELQRVFEQAPVAICVFRGPANVFEVVNPLMADILGRRAGELMGRPFFEVMPELAAQGLLELLDGVRQTGVSFVAQEQALRLGHPAGGMRYFNYVYQPLLDAEGPITGVVCVATEVTDEVRARQQVQAFGEEMQATNAELHDTNNRLLRTNSDLDTFVYTASHDLKAPISNIEGLLLALRHDLPAAVLQQGMITRLLDLIQDSVERFQQTIGHLTDISQLQQPEAIETVNLRALIQGVQLDLGPLIESAQARLTVAVDGCEAVRVAPKTLRSVVYNLLSNAVKYRHADRAPLVQLRARCTPSQLALEVQDNGLGLSEAQQGQLFGMFRRLHTHVEGSGVGLFMVKRLIENAGGTIAVHSQVGEGTTFTVTLPA